MMAPVNSDRPLVLPLLPAAGLQTTIVRNRVGLGGLRRRGQHVHQDQRSATSVPCFASSVMRSPFSILPIRSAVNCLGTEMDGRRNGPGSTGHASIRNQGHLITLILQVTEQRGQAMQFRHACRHRTLTAQNHNNIPVQIACLIGRLDLCLGCKYCCWALMTCRFSATADVLITALPRLPFSIFKPPLTLCGSVAGRRMSTSPDTFGAARQTRPPPSRNGSLA